MPALSLHPVDEAQVLSHLRSLDCRVGLLINFHEVLVQDGIHRIVHHYREEWETQGGVGNAEDAEGTLT